MISPNPKYETHEAWSWNNGIHCVFATFLWWNCTTFNSTLPRGFNSTKLVHFIKCIYVLFRDRVTVYGKSETRQNHTGISLVLLVSTRTDHSLMQCCVQRHYHSEFEPQYSMCIWYTHVTITRDLYVVSSMCRGCNRLSFTAKSVQAHKLFYGSVSKITYSRTGFCIWNGHHTQRARCA